MSYEFGNDPAKIERYKKFWNCEPVKRPLVGFSMLSWFPLDEFAASRAWPKDQELTPGMVNVEDFLDDWEANIREGEILDDDLIRGCSPHQGIFWCCGTLGSKMRVLPGNVVAEDQSLSWDEVLNMKLNLGHPWFRKYIEFIEALVKRSNGRFPVSHGTLVGPLDYCVALRGHEQTAIDMLEEPEKASQFMQEMGDVFLTYTKEAWKHIPQWHGGYYDAQYRIWAPGSIARLQEDAIAVMSPQLYKDYIQPVDRKVASQFQNCFMHCHATTMFVLDLLLEVKEIKMYEVNQDVGGPPVEWLIPYLKRIQKAGVPVMTRGDFTTEDVKKLMGELDPAGLYLYILVKEPKDADKYRPIVGM